ncbi:MAG: hypothetical protein ACK5Y6_04495 [Pseudomonadota bacterium]|jgi:hypothetical protein
MRINQALVALIAGSLSGCATLLSGIDQEIAVTTNPPGAACELIRSGEKIASVPTTPATTLVRKTKDDIKLVCKKDGYVSTEATLVSGSDSRTYANMLFGGWGLVLWGLDSMTGSDNSYPKAPALTLAVTPQAARHRRIKS